MKKERKANKKRAKMSAPKHMRNSVYLLNNEKKAMRCLGCGSDILTDRCNRFCANCKRRNTGGGHSFLAPPSQKVLARTTKVEL